MKRIRVIAGRVGVYIDGNYVAMRKESGAFEVSDDMAKKLVSAGAAEYVLDPDMIPGIGEVEEAETPLAEKSLKELKEIAEELGIGSRNSKTAYVKSIESYYEEEDAPDLSVADPV